MSDTNKIPKEFIQISKDFLNDFSTTFPEYKEKLNPNLVFILESSVDDLTVESEAVIYVFNHCRLIMPERFFDILYKNEKIFHDDAINCEFIPGINFKELWKIEDISSSTRETIWKYLQLFLFSIVESLDDKSSFGDTAKLFEAIDESELKFKIQEVIEQMKDIFNHEKGYLVANGNLIQLCNLFPN